MSNLLWTVISVLFIFWLFGVVTSFGGPLIHTILVVMVIILIYNFITKGKATL
ncbi:lmo0937 family membrane protein [Armatimonas sp.]|uniref:lmo0937 family membrane protein n=1 Tax=Armatimonas sp. TaxID=1872638 RepID=UPI00375061AE